MKVIIRESKGKTGKGKFTLRLKPALEKLGVTVIHDENAEADVCLHVGRIHFKSKAKINVLRVGPANVNSAMDYKKINAEKWKSVKQADAIIYQSEYSKKAYDTFVGKTKKPYRIIFNGANPADYIGAKKWVSPYRYNFLASTRVFLPQKRLKSIIKAFKLADIEDSCLWIAGDARKYRMKYKAPNIQFLGDCDDRKLARLYRLCDAMIHIVYLDACPNSVVEAIVAGCKVIVSDQGGTKELLDYMNPQVWDKPFKFKPINLNKPPKVNLEYLAENMLMITCDPRKNEAKHLYIDHIAKQYKEFFECLTSK